MVGKRNALFVFIGQTWHVISPHIFDRTYSFGAINCKGYITKLQHHTALECMS